MSSTDRNSLMPSGKASLQARSGLHIGFDEMALIGLVFAIYQLGPEKSVNAFLGFWGNLFGSVAAGFGSVLGGGIDWAGEGVGDFGEWLGGLVGL